MLKMNGFVYYNTAIRIIPTWTKTPRFGMTIVMSLSDYGVTVLMVLVTKERFVFG